jgi:hypothetical protein
LCFNFINYYRFQLTRRRGIYSAGNFDISLPHALVAMAASFASFVLASDPQAQLSVLGMASVETPGVSEGEDHRSRTA